MRVRGYLHGELCQVLSSHDCLATTTHCARDESTCSIDRHIAGLCGEAGHQDPLVVLQKQVKPASSQPVTQLFSQSANQPLSHSAIRVRYAVEDNLTCDCLTCIDVS